MKSILATAFFASLFVSGCRAEEPKSSQQFLIPSPNYVVNKYLPFGQELSRRLAPLQLNLKVAELTGGPEDIDLGYGFFHQDYTTFTCNNFTCIKASNILLFYLINGKIFINSNEPNSAVGSYSTKEDGTLLIEEICTGKYKPTCTMSYDKTNKLMSIKML